jgi:hypothetical protein
VVFFMSRLLTVGYRLNAGGPTCIMPECKELCWLTHSEKSVSTTYTFGVMG